MAQRFSYPEMACCYLIVLDGFSFHELIWVFVFFLNLCQILASLVASEMEFHNLLSNQSEKNIISFVMNCPISFT